MTMIEVRTAPPYSPLDHAAFFFPLVLALLVLFYISYIAVSRDGKLVQWTVLFILSYGRKQIKVGQQQVATAFIFLSHITMWEGWNPNAHHLDQLFWSSMTEKNAGMSGSFKRRKDRHWLLTEWDLLLATFSHDTTTGLIEIRSVAIIEVNDTVLWD